MSWSQDKISFVHFLFHALHVTVYILTNGSSSSRHSPELKPHGVHNHPVQIKISDLFCFFSKRDSSVANLANSMYSQWEQLRHFIIKVWQLWNWVWEMILSSQIFLQEFCGIWNINLLYLAICYSAAAAVCYSVHYCQFWFLFSCSSHCLWVFTKSGLAECILVF